MLNVSKVNEVDIGKQELGCSIEFVVANTSGNYPLAGTVPCSVPLLAVVPPIRSCLIPDMLTPNLLSYLGYFKLGRSVVLWMSNFFLGYSANFSYVGIRWYKLSICYRNVLCTLLIHYEYAKN